MMARLTLTPPPAYIATRSEGLARLTAFLPHAGASHTANRNLDLPGHPHVSGLSPWLRYRLVTEAEVITAVRARHPRGADKFLAEVWWRTYWKGWLQSRPGIWRGYLRGLRDAEHRLATEAGLRLHWEHACLGQTGIDGFDDWAQDLVATGYLHNHARMWFASIWIFTLRLPWELGAAFFLRHLVDGDPASNTLSWRWVAGLHTMGKHYVATAENIARNTQGRFRPAGLAVQPAPLPFVPHPAPQAPERNDAAKIGDRWALLVTQEDLCPGPWLCAPCAPVSVAAWVTGNEPQLTARHVTDFVAGGTGDALARLGAPDAPRFSDTDPGAIVQWAQGLGIDTLVTAFAPVGPVSDALDVLGSALGAQGTDLVRVMRSHDRDAWPHATRGFFPFREQVMG